MQMQKKITTKEDGRFLVFYHFPNTATEEETRVFEEIEEKETQSTIHNPQSTMDASLNPQPSTLNSEEAHV